MSEQAKPVGYVSSLSDGAIFMLEDPTDIGIALYTAPQLFRLDDEAEFEVHCNGDYAASACGPRDRAWAEIQRYALVYQRDGEITIYEVTRTPVSSSSTGERGHE